jgi:hypothetical protein
VLGIAVFAGGTPTVGVKDCGGDWVGGMTTVGVAEGRIAVGSGEEVAVGGSVAAG